MSARAWVDSSNYQLGDPITLHVELRHARGARVQPPVGDSLGAFTVLGRMPVTPAGDSGSATGLVLAYYDSGTVMIPPAEVPYSMPGDSAIRLALTNPVPVSVHLVAVDTPENLREHFTEAEIVDLGWRIVTFVGYGRFIYALGLEIEHVLYRACELEPLVTAEAEEHF